MRMPGDQEVVPRQEWSRIWRKNSGVLKDEAPRLTQNVYAQQRMPAVLSGFQDRWYK